MRVYKALEGETLDEIVFRFFGSIAPLEAILEANRGIAAKGERFEKDTLVFIPEFSEIKKPVKLKSIWD